MRDLERIKQRAMLDYGFGFNCAQSVFRQFCLEYGLDLEMCTKIASGFGGGLKMAKTCGAVSGAVMSLGLVFGYDDSEDQISKEKLNTIILHFLNEFQKKFQTTDCKEILGIDVTIPGNRQKAQESGILQRICPDCITTAIDIVSLTIDEFDNK